MRSDSSTKGLSVPLILAVVGVGSVVTSTAEAQEFLLGPPNPAQPTVVTFGFDLTDVVEVDEGSERFAFEGVLTLEWRHDGIALDPTTAGVSEKSTRETTSSPRCSLAEPGGALFSLVQQSAQASIL